MRTLADWPVGTKGKTTRGDTYLVAWHDVRDDVQPLLVVLNGQDPAWARLDGTILGRLDDLIHPAPRLRPMTQAECSNWARKQPCTIVVKRGNSARLAKQASYLHPVCEYRFADVVAGGGWQPLPLVKE